MPIRHNLEAFAGITGMRYALSLGRLTGRMADGNRCRKDLTDSEFKQRKVKSRDRKRDETPLLTMGMEPLGPADLKLVLCWTFQVSPSEVASSTISISPALSTGPGTEQALCNVE